MTDKITEVLRTNPRGFDAIDIAHRLGTDVDQVTKKCEAMYRMEILVKVHNRYILPKGM